MSIISQTSLPSSTPDIVIRDVICDASVAVGDWVRIDSGTAVQALADDVDNANVIGIVEYKAGATKANIRVAGVTGEIFAGLDTSKEYFLSDIIPGGMVPQGSTPTAANHIVLKVGKPFSTTRFLVQQGIRFIRS